MKSVDRYLCWQGFSDIVVKLSRLHVSWVSGLPDIVVKLSRLDVSLVSKSKQVLFIGGLCLWLINYSGRSVLSGLCGRYMCCEGVRIKKDDLGNINIKKDSMPMQSVNLNRKTCKY